MGEALLTSTVFQFPFRQTCSRYSLTKIALILLFLLATVMVIHAHEADAPPASDIQVFEGTSDTMAYGVGRSLLINGTVRNGAISLGGDVVIKGVVEGDVAAIGGSVTLLSGARVGGDVIVVGGTYRAEPGSVREPGKDTIMYAGYEHELKSMMRNPTGLLTPKWSPTYIGVRLLAVLFWFVVSLALTSAMPGTISRGMARLQLTSLRVAIIGIVGAIIIGPGVLFSLHYLPTPIGVVVGLMALLLILIAWLFGRVILHAATGRWLQRRFLPIGKNSESVALLMGTIFWVVISSLPYIWPLAVAAIFITSLGLALTARYRVGWKTARQPST